MAVKVFGWAHGVLFIDYMVVLGLCWMKLGWSRRFVLKTDGELGATWNISGN